MKKIFLILLFSIFAMGCASTGYRQAEKPTKYGYFDSNVQDNIFEVQYKGNSYTDIDEALDFNLLRCAEVCLENGYTTFNIISSQDYTKTSSTNHSYGNANAYGYGSSYGSKYNSNSYGGANAFGYTTSYTETKVYPYFMTRIECFKDESGTLKAEQIKNNLVNKHNLQWIKEEVFEQNEEEK